MTPRPLRRLCALSSLTLALGTLGAVGLLAGPAQAAAGNDDLADALPLAVGTPVTADPTGATTEDGEGDLDGCDDAADSLWYTVTPATTGSYVVLTSGASSTYDSMVDVFEGAGPDTGIDDLVGDACDDNAGTGLLSQSLVTLTAGTTYWVRLSLHGSGPTGGPVQLEVDHATPPAADALAAATTVSSGSTTAVDDVAATEQSGEPTDDDCGEVVGSVWLRWTATATGSMVFSTQDGADNPDTVLALWSGPATGATPGSLDQVDCNDDGPGDQMTSVLKVKVTAGQTYYLQAGAVDEEDQGSFQVVAGTTTATVKAASSMNVHAPKKVKAGQQPIVKVAVTRAGKAGTGSVAFTMNGKALKTVSLSGGAASVKLSSLKPGRYTVVATYAGNDTTMGSTVKVKIKVMKKAKTHH